MTQETRETILLVDDDEPTQRLLEALLRRNGYQAELAANGREAIDLLLKREYAAVVLDLMMPAVGGREVIDFLATAVRKPPVIVCTAAGIAASSNLDTAIVRAIVRKPFDIEEFVGVLKTLLP